MKYDVVSTLKDCCLFNHIFETLFTTMFACVTELIQNSIFTVSVCILKEAKTQNGWMPMLAHCLGNMFLYVSAAYKLDMTELSFVSTERAIFRMSFAINIELNTAIFCFKNLVHISLCLFLVFISLRTHAFSCNRC